MKSEIKKSSRNYKKSNKCPGFLCKNKALDPHRCPFDQELGNGSRICTCCQNCTNDCAMEI